jgi:hypothetical protein
MSDVSSEAAVMAIVQRAEGRFQKSRRELFVSMDRLFAVLMGAQWLFGLVLALTVSPWAWAGKERTVHPHVLAALVLGTLLSAMPIALAFLRPGWVVTRHVIAVAQMLWSALLVHLTGGRIETHFHVFGSLGILAGYRDWPVLVTATVVVAVEHFVRGMAWPESIYGIVNPEWWRFLEHAFWVVFAASFLAVLARRGVREMQALAEQGAELEAMAEGEWRKSSVVSRAAS